MGIETKIQNSHLLTDIFGYFPSFHDAEVLRIILDRGDAHSFNPNLQATIHVFHVTPEIDERRRYVLKNHVLATFRFLQIVELSLADFNQQNVLQRLSIIDISDRQLERVKFQVLIDGIHGVTAEFQCYSINLESVEPYVRDDS